MDSEKKQVLLSLFKNMFQLVNIKKKKKKIFDFTRGGQPLSLRFMTSSVKAKKNNTLS